MDAANRPVSGPLPRWLGTVLEPLYHGEITRRNRRFDRGVGVTKLDVPVISVGNLSVGGTGKTPMVMHIVATLLREGHRPCIAMRGYRKGKVGEADETDAYRREFPRTPIVAQPDRIAGLRKLLASSSEKPGPNCVVLDDGFQHRRIARNLDIVLIDASRSPFADRLLPAGWLREPAASLGRADCVVVTHAELVEESAISHIDAGVRHIRSGRGLDAIARHLWTALVTADESAASTSERVLPLDWLLGKRVVASCAIGNPRGFMKSLRDTLGGEAASDDSIAGTLILPDHDPYGREIVLTLARMAKEKRADAIVVTDKDWSKLRVHSPGIWGGTPVVRPRLALGFERGSEVIERMVLKAAAGSPHGRELQSGS